MNPRIEVLDYMHQCHAFIYQVARSHWLTTSLIPFSADKAFFSHPPREKRNKKMTTLMLPPA
jgi:hypothetical protein